MTLSRRCFALAITMSLLSVTVAQGGVLALKAVKVNDEVIAPTDTVDVCPGDTVETEILLSDWSANGEQLVLWQVQLDSEGYVSGSEGTVLPHGYDAPLIVQECKSDVDCSEGLHCDFGCGSVIDGRCVGPDYDPPPGAFIDTLRADYVYAGSISIPGVDLCATGPNYRYGALYFSGPSPVYAPPPKYGGTLILDVSKDASGTFVIAFLPGTQTLMKDENNHNILPLELQSLAVNVATGGGLPCRLAESDPPNCAIDPRQPSSPSGANTAGWDRISLTFDSDTSGLSEADFEVDDLTPSPPQIQTLTPSPTGETLTVVFDRRIRTGRWTCVTYLLRPKTTCVGFLPGDIDGNGTSNAEDVSLLIEHINGTLDPPLATWQCDLDRSGNCTAADLLRAIDLLNGGDGYDEWLGRSIFPVGCPSVQ